MRQPSPRTTRCSCTCSTRIGPLCGVTTISRGHRPRNGKRDRPLSTTRTMFVPKLPYVGPAQIEVGLYSVKSGQRVPLGGENTGDRSIRVATFNMQLPANALSSSFAMGGTMLRSRVRRGSSGSGPGSRARSRSATPSRTSPLSSISINQCRRSPSRRRSRSGPVMRSLTALHWRLDSVSFAGFR